MTDKYINIIEKLDYAFQPIIHSHTGKIFAVEALIRNVDKIPKFNQINDLFDYAFQEDYLYQLDLLLREKAIKKFKDINIENLKLFYNLDNRIIYDKTLSPENTAKILNKYNLSKDIICFELSEKGTQIEQGALSSMIQTYKKSGYCIAIDDFGIGVSGLKLLYFSEANVVKLDRFFITNIDKDQKKKLFCSSIIEMAHIMGMKVVAEGVETTNEYYTCKDIGADFIQGYIVQKPTTNVLEIKSKYTNITDILENDKRNDFNPLINPKYIDYIKPLNINSSLYKLFLYFKENTNNTFVPIIDDHKNLLGVIYEVDIKKVSYSQYGLSLAKNMTFSSTLKKYIKPALSVESSWGIDKVLETYNQSSLKNKGIYITQSNVYEGFINLSSLLTLSYQRNIEIATNQNPLTKLPGNQQIDKFINKSLKHKNKRTTHIMYFDFNDFKPFNDHYGFRQGDRAILIFSELIQKKYPKDTFIAHVGGDDFFVGVKDGNFAEIFILTQNILEEFKNSCKNLYNKEDKINNFILTEDRYKIERKFNLLSCSCALVEISINSNVNNFDHTISLLKKHSKKYSFPLSASI